MGIRSLCAAAVVAVGVGSAADAATYDVIFTVTEAMDEYIGDDDEQYVATPLSGWWGFDVNAPVAGTLSVSDDDNTVSLDVAGNRLFEDYDSIGGIGGGGVSWLFGVGGSALTELRWFGDRGALIYLSDNRPDYTSARATLSLAPVPLPAAAALLPLGIGALAMMRKRRRS